MKELNLVEPDLKYKKSFLEFVRDVKKSGYETYELYAVAENNFEVFITCDADNTGSKKIIKNFKGVYTRSFVDCETVKDVLQYKVSTKRIGSS